MDEFDDNRDTLEDIKALEKALTQDDVNDNEVNENNDLLNRNSSVAESKKFLSISKLKHSSRCKSPQFHEPADIINAVYENNERLIHFLKLVIEVVTTKLEECTKRQQEVDYQIQLISKGGKVNWKIHYVKAGMPYFKDEKFFPAPMNQDTKRKQSNNELSIVYLRRPTRWTAKDRNIMKIAVRAQAANEAFDKMIRETEENTEVGNYESEYIPPKDLLAMVGPLSSREFDWMKISTIDLKGRHTPNECRVIWNILLHPEINSSKWTSDEDAMLKMLAKSHRHEDWDMISKELCSNRSAYVSFIRYNTLFGTAYTDTLWTSVENNILTKCIEKLKFGDFIPWGRISTYINDRTKNQIYSRWKYNLDPSVKKGRFTGDEDQLLLDSVSKFGTNFPRISAEIMPHRTSVQLSGRFRLLMLKTNRSYNSWTISEDRKLLQLYEEFGSQWSMIANIMKKDRTYLRHRYTIIKRHMCKGAKLTSIPRKRTYDEIHAERMNINNDNTNSNKFNNDDEHNDDWNIKIKCGNNSNMSIDSQLIKYFQSIQASNVKPGRKPTYHTADQLKSHTKKLYNIFEKLDIKFDIPDNLNNFNISIKDKELLMSLKKYYVEKSNSSLKIIEKYRKKMFGDINIHDKSEHFIPPAPFGLFQGRVSKCPSDKIEINTVSNNCHIDLIMGFKTPDNITEILTNEENISFDKLQSLIKKECKISLFPGRFERAFIQSIENVNNIYVEKLRSLDQQSNILVHHVNDDINASRQQLLDKGIFVEPCQSNLLGYQNLLVMKDIFSNSNMENDELLLNEVKLTSEGRKAFHLFKTRLFRLFKYPIIMARMSPNNHIKKIPHVNISDNIFNYLHGEISNDCEESLVNKKLGEKNFEIAINSEEILPEVRYEIKYDPAQILDSEQLFNDDMPQITNSSLDCKKYFVVTVNLNNAKQEKN